MFWTLRWSAAAAVAWILGSYLHTETYVWQSTTLAAWVRPVRRTECRLVSHGFDGRPHQPLASSKSKNLRIAILFLYDGSARGGNGNDGGQSWNDRLMQRVIRNRQEYARRHGYTLINANTLVDPALPAAWSKLRAMDHYLSKTRPLAAGQTNSTAAAPASRLSDATPPVSTSVTSSSTNPGSPPGPLFDHSPPGPHPPPRPLFDYVLYVDMDVVLMDLSRRLEDFIDAAHTANAQADLIMGEDWNGPNPSPYIPFFFIFRALFIPAHTRLLYAGPNTGVWLARAASNGSSQGLGFTSWFLRTAYAQAPRLSPKREEGSGRPHPFEYEQVGASHTTHNTHNTLTTPTTHTAHTPHTHHTHHIRYPT